MSLPSARKNTDPTELLLPITDEARTFLEGSEEGQRLVEEIEAAQIDANAAMARLERLSTMLAGWDGKATRPGERKSLTRLEEMAEDVGYSGSDTQGMIDAVYAAVPGDSEALDVIESVCAEYGYTRPWEKVARPTGRLESGDGKAARSTQASSATAGLAERLEREAAAAEQRLAALEREPEPEAA